MHEDVDGCIRNFVARTGSRRQRIALPEASKAVAPSRADLNLKERFLWGDMPATSCHDRRHIDVSLDDFMFVIVDAASHDFDVRCDQ